MRTIPFNDRQEAIEKILMYLGVLPATLRDVAHGPPERAGA